MKSFKQLREATYSRYSNAIQRYNTSSSANRGLTPEQIRQKRAEDTDNVTHKINSNGDHEFTGEHRTVIIPHHDTEGLKKHMEWLHDEVLGHGNTVTLNAGTKNQKHFYGGAPGVDKLYDTITAKTESYDIDAMLEYIEDLETQLESLTGQMGSELGAKFGAKIRTGKQPKKQIDPNKTGKVQWGSSSNTHDSNDPYQRGSKID